MADEKGERVRRMFASISRRYDLLNTLLSLNRDAAWRRFTVSQAGLEEGGRALDVATGTGKLAVELAKAVGAGGKVVGVDFCEEMMELGRKAIRGAWLEDVIEFQNARAEALPFPDSSFDCASIAFGLRNVSDIDRSLSEMARVVRPGGRVLVLEFTQPEGRVLRELYYLYFFRVLPLVGGVISGNRDAYTYLPASVMDFPSPEGLKARMEAAGLRDVEYHLLTGGIVALHVGVRP
ncbi:MAG: bifunctional demethylmenaquinone methyltransferase/2-methoxy-6-polyprenyl-1,4-benzoquinol methylase UbiE [Euryarchaeota archaeon]|nr:bifunctional demethylmenaquinone methyltransferase/2-methoxy-6-polyprenyl-1,4-benzoquinol methylase UbiE [Euryarchaeota archaeon]